MAGRRAFTREEEARILQSFRGKYAARNRALFTLMMKTGLRVSEALSLRVRQVVSDGEIVDEVEVPRRSMKGQKSGRHVMLQPAAQAALRKWLTEAAPLTGLVVLDLESYVFKSTSRGNTHKPMCRQ